MTKNLIKGCKKYHEKNSNQILVQDTNNNLAYTNITLASRLKENSKYSSCSECFWGSEFYLISYKM